MEFTKVHGLGNDFVFVNCLQNSIKDPAGLAIKICHRRFGVGADGLVLILPSEKADFMMRIYNSDGSEAEMCGNAIRCFARYVYEKGLTKKTKIEVETLAGIMVPEIIDLEQFLVRVDMGIPKLKAEVIPTAGQGEKVIDVPLEVEGEVYRITAVSTGNPHCVLFVSNIESAPVTTLGPKIEKHEFFPKKTNVEFIEVVNRQEINMRVWERGAAETLACGTGASASVVASVLNGYTEREVKVHLPGGDLFIEWAQDDHVYMTGPTVEVFTGILNENF